MNFGPRLEFCLWWSDSNVRLPVRKAIMRMSESKDYQQIMSSRGALDLKFLKFNGKLAYELQIQSPRWNEGLLATH